MSTASHVRHTGKEFPFRASLLYVLWISSFKVRPYGTIEIWLLLLHPLYYYYILSPFYRPVSRWIWVSRYQNISILDFIGAKDDGGGGGYWSHKTCQASVKSSLPSNQHPVFYRPDAKPTMSEHWRKITFNTIIIFKIKTTITASMQYLTLVEQQEGRLACKKLSHQFPVVSRDPL